MTRAGVFETVVGLIVILVAGFFFAYAYGLAGNSIGTGQYRVDAVFGRIDGIAIGSEVRIAGVKVGEVKEQSLNSETYEADVSFIIEEGVLIPEDSIAKIVSDGLLGGAYVVIEPGASEEMLRDGDKIVITQGSVDLLGLAVQAFTNPQNNSDDNDESENDDELSLDPLGDL